MFTGVWWLATGPMVTTLHGRDGGTKPVSEKEDIGIVRPLRDNTPTTDLFR